VKKTIILVCLAVIVLGGTGFSCSLRSMELKKTAPEFSVHVTHQSKSIAGIKVLISPKGDNERLAFEGTTDERGFVNVSGLRSGEYFLTVTYLDFEAGKEWIEIVESAKVDDKTSHRFEFEWADGSIETNTVAGILTGLVPGNTGNKLKDIVNPVSAVYPGIAITLSAAFFDETYRLVSDSSGQFFFSPVKPGIYLLTIAGGEKFVYGVANETRMILDVTPSSQRKYLKLKLKDSGCYSVEYVLESDS
jgi:hypothetical protein